MRAAFFWFLLIALAALWFLLPPETVRASNPRVKDGDTMILNGVAYRLDGIDAPEYHQLCADALGRPWTCGKDARTRLAQLAVGALTCEVSGEDRYGRKLATCKPDLGEAMVAAGLAISDGSYEKAQASARAAKRGIWAGKFTTPAEWRAAHPRKDIP